MLWPASRQKPASASCSVKTKKSGCWAASPAMKKLIAMVMEAAKAGNVPVTICGLAVGNPVNTVQYLQMGLRSFSVSPQNLLRTKKTLLEADAHPDDAELE